MGTELLNLPDGQIVPVNYSSNTTLDAVLAVIPTILTTLVQNGIVATSVFVKAVEDRKVKVAYIHQRSRTLREDIIPVTVLAEVNQNARDWVKNRNFDPDIRQKVLDALNKRFDDRLSRYSN